MEKLTKEQAIEKIKSWAEMLEVNDDTEDFEDAAVALLPAVRNNRLVFDEEREVFTLVLSAPLVMDKSSKESIEIKELTLDEKSCIEKYNEKDKITMLTAIYSKSAGISLAEASKIKGRDFTVITAINSVFFS